jgi:hypothetical protein
VDPEKILHRVTAAHGAGAALRTRALALRMFGCLADQGEFQMDPL